MQPALAQVSTLNSPFEQDIEDYSAGKCSAVELWWGKLESFLQQKSEADVRRLLDLHEVTVPVASFQGGLLATQGESRRAAWSLFARRLAIAGQIGAKTLVVAADILGPLQREDFDRIRVSLRQAAQQAGEQDLRIALEFQAHSVLCNNLQTAVALVDEADHPALGVCLDVFHFFTGPSKLSDLAYVTADNLFHVQFSDLTGVLREMASDADRILPGDGDFELDVITDHLRRIDYRGHVSVELMNPQVFQISPRSFGEIAMTALRKVLGLAEL